MNTVEFEGTLEQIKQVKDAIQKGRVYWHEYNANGIWDHETRDQHLNTDK